MRQLEQFLTVDKQKVIHSRHKVVDEKWKTKEADAIVCAANGETRFPAALMQ